MAVIGVMRLLGMLSAAFCALAATAAAGPIDESPRPAPEADRTSAFAAERNGVADPAVLSGARRGRDPGGKSRAGNPLWEIPLSSLSATRERPLFSASRRPPVVAAPIVAPQKHEVLAPPPPERPLLTLVGTIVSRKASVAMLQGSNAEVISRLRVGQENNGWQVRGIGLRSIIVEKGAQSVELDLPRPNKAPATSSGPTIPGTGDRRPGSSLNRAR
jgi:general secretion pathway protein N